MQTISKKSIVIILSAVIVYAIIFSVIALMIVNLHYDVNNVSAESLFISKTVGIILSLYAIATPWRWQKRLVPSLNGINASTSRIWGFFILFCFAPLIAPLIYGLVLFFMGISINEFFYFVGISIAGGLMWGVYNLRKS